MDGLELYLQQAGETSIQNNFYNGWTHDHYVIGVFVFCLDGTSVLPSVAAGCQGLGMTAWMLSAEMFTQSWNDRYTEQLEPSTQMTLFSLRRDIPC
jgi:hypothetical protein